MKVATVLAGIVSLACLIVWFLALHDIGNDYVSPLMLQHFGVETSLPDWTACPLEWKALQIGFIPIFLFHTLYFISTVRMKKRG